jgi:hypothetical protein
MQTRSRSEAPSSAVYVAWQDPGTRQWHTIARLAQVGTIYEFGFTRGAEAVKAVVKQLFNSNLGEHYVSSDLISVFRNKIPPRSRSDFPKLASWLNLNGNESDFEMLGKFGLIPGSDGIIVYSAPSVRNGRYAVEFFMHGIRHTHGEAGEYHRHGDVLKWCQTAKSGDRLFPLLDVQNDLDVNAIALRAEESTVLLGYVPRFYSTDLRTILGRPECASTAEFQILRNNNDAPIQFRMLCRFTSMVPSDFQPLDDADHEMQPTLVPASLS